MTGRRDRQKAILEIVRRKRIDSQQTLAEELGRRGIQVSQATLSRDIQQLALVKVGSVYAAGPGEVRRTTEQALRRVLRDYVVSVDSVAPLIVMKTQSGTSATVAEAVDGAGWPEIVGTLAGENTIFILCRSPEDLRQIMLRIETHRE